MRIKLQYKKDDSVGACVLKAAQSRCIMQLLSAVCCAPACRYWNQVDFSGDLVLAGDGAGSDNTAIKPLLRRKVPKIIQFITAFTTLQNMTADEWAGYQWETSGEA